MNPGFEARPSSALARGVQITEFKDSRVNPEPILVEDSDVLMEQYLSPGKLRGLTGVQNLEVVQSLEMKVDTTETSLGNFGSLLPNLSQLRLSNSMIPCIRDLGSSLRSLQVLWMSRCALTELDGVSSMSSLKELYLSYNEISDLSPLSMLDRLQILDLEGNNVDDMSQIQHLSMCPQLNSLTLDGNAICVQPSPDSEPDENYDYRQTVRSWIPHLKILDEEILTAEPSTSKKSNVFDADWAYLEELQNDIGLQGSTESINSSGEVSKESSRPSSSSRPGSAAIRPSTGYKPGTVLRPSSGFRPLTAGRRPATVGIMRPATAGASRPDTAGARTTPEGASMEDAASDLTLGNVICGNPSKALLSRRKLPSQQEKESTDVKLFPEFRHIPEHSYDVPEDNRDRSEIEAELREWKKEHEKRMAKIHEQQKAQVLVIDHDDAISLSDDDDDEVSTDEEDKDDDVDDDVIPRELIAPSEEPLPFRLPQSVMPPAEKVTFSEAKIQEQFRRRAEGDPVIQRYKQGRRHVASHHDESLSLDHNRMDNELKAARRAASPLRPFSPTARAMNPRPQSPILNLPGDHKGPVIPRPPVRDGANRNFNPSQVPVQPVIRGDRPVPPNRPSTARAILQPSIPSQTRIRRQLPSVLSLPSRPSVPK